MTDKQRVEGRRRRLVDRGMLRGADIEVEIWRYRNQREHQAGQRKQPGAACRGIPRGGEEAQATEHDEGAAAEPGADEQGPDPATTATCAHSARRTVGSAAGSSRSVATRKASTAGPARSASRWFPIETPAEVDDQEEQPRGSRLPCAGGGASASPATTSRRS